MNYTHPMGHAVTLTSQTGQATGSDNAHSAPVKTKYSTGGIFILEVDQAGTHVNETLDVDIEVYDLLTDDWYVIASFTQVGDADSVTGTSQELINIPYGLGGKISCKWTVAGTESTNTYSFTVSGTLK